MSRATTTDRPGVGPGFEPPPDSRIAELLDGIKSDAALLARQEASLASQELKEAAGTVTRDAVWIGVGAVVVAVALALMLTSVGFAAALAWSLTGLSTLASAALGFLTTALVLGGIGCIVMIWGWRHLKEAELTPTRTLQTLKGLAEFSPSSNRRGAV